MSDPVVLLSTGDVVGPAGGVTDNSMVLFSGTSGKIIKGNNAVVTAAGLALLDDVDAAAQRTTLGLKTGAVTNKTTSTTDPTVGSLTKVGDFGVGGMLDLRSTIFVTGKPQDLYSKGFVKGFADGGPAGLAIPGIVGINYGVLEVNAHWSEPSGADGIMRSFTQGGAGVVYTQAMANATTWGSWVKNGASAAWRLSTTAAIDLNTITEGGWFQGILGATNANLPALGYFYLQVMNYESSPGNCTQVAYEYTSSTTPPRQFIRGSYAGTWTPWREIALINSPAFTGVPTAPTPSIGTRSTAIATMQNFANEFGASLAANGYQKLPSGLIIQWGSLSVNTDATGAVVFPVAFPNAFLNAHATAVRPSASNDYGVSVNSTSTTGLSIVNDGVTTTVYWMALGY